MNIKTKTIMSLAFAAVLTACSPFPDDPVNSNVGESVSIAQNGNVLSANIVDAEGVNLAAGVSYLWTINGRILGMGETLTIASDTLKPGESLEDIALSVGYTDNAGFVESFETPAASSDTATSAQYASITDTDTSDSGELRYKFPSGMTTGKATFSVLYPAGETERFYMTLFDTSTSNSGMIGELQMDEGKFYNRVGGSSTAITAPDFVPGTAVNVSSKWDTTDMNAATYTIEIGDSFTETFTAENAAEVTHLSLKLSSNSGTANNAVQVDDLAIYSDEAGITKVFSDDFESYALDHDLDASPYNSSTFSAVVAGTTTTETTDTTSNQYASITDMDTSDSDELRYKFPNGLTTGKASFSVLYPAGETERFYMTLFDTNTNNAGMIGELQMDEGKFYNRVGGSSTAITAPDYVPGELVSVVLKWDTSDANAATYTIEIGDSFVESFTAENAAEVTHLSLKLSSNSGTASNAVKIDDLAIYSDEAGTTGVFSDDFESYAIGHDLDASPYNSSTFSAVVAGTATTTTTATPNQVASITDNDTSDSGELRYKFASGMTTGKASFSVLYPAGETERFYMTLFDTNTNNAGMIGELQMDEGKFYNRISGSSTAIDAPDFTPGSLVSVVLKWDTSDTSAATYTIEIDGTYTKTFTAENPAEVTHLSLKLSSNSGTAANAVEVDNLAIYSDVAGTTGVFSDDFESYTVGHDLDASPYNSSTFSAVVAVSSN